MAARRMWILSLLAAVFLMHSIASADPGAGRGPTAGHGSSAASGPGTPQTSGASELPSPESWVGPAAAMVDPVLPGVPMDDVAPHFLAVCLAVLLAGLGWLMSRGKAPSVATPVVRFAAPRPRLDMGWVRPPRPPDLSALCILRI